MNFISSYMEQWGSQEEVWIVNGPGKEEACRIKVVKESYMLFLIKNDII